MANIREYTATGGIQPQEGGPSTLARAATRMGVLGNQQADEVIRAAGERQAGLNAIGRGVKEAGAAVEKWQAAKEINAGTADYMKTITGLDQDWNKLRSTTDPNTAVGQDWRDKTMTPALDKLAEQPATPEGRAHMRALINQGKMHYLASTTSGDALAAGDGALRNLQTTFDDATKRSHADFTTGDHNAAVIREATEATIRTGVFTPEQAVKMRDHADAAVKENTRAQLQGAAERNPGAFLAQLERGDFDKMGLPQKDMTQLREYGRHMEREAKADARNAAVDGEIATQKRSEATLQKILNGTAPDANGVEHWPTLAEARTNNDLTSRDRTFLQAVIIGKPTRDGNAPEVYTRLERRVGDRTDPLTIDDLTDAVSDPDPSKRISGREAKVLGAKITKSLNGEEKLWSDDLKGAKAMASKSAGLDTMIPTPSSAGQAYAASHWLDTYVEEARRQGASRKDIFDPQGKFYFANDPGFREIFQNPERYDMTRQGPAAPAPAAPAAAPLAPPPALMQPPRKPGSLPMPQTSPSKTSKDIWGAKP